MHRALVDHLLAPVKQTLSAVLNKPTTEGAYTCFTDGWPTLARLGVALGRAAKAAVRHPLVSADAMSPERSGFRPSSKEVAQRVAVLLERRALLAMVQRADSLAGLRSSITRNDELLLVADASADEGAKDHAGMASMLRAAVSATSGPLSSAGDVGIVVPLPPTAALSQVVCSLNSLCHTGCTLPVTVR